MALPDNIANLQKPTEDDVPTIDAWAKTVHPSIEVKWGEHRAAPPRMPGRGESIEEARARNPGPPCLRVRVVERRTGQVMENRVFIHSAGTATRVAGLAAMTELEVYRAANEQILKAHALSDAVLLSGLSPRDVDRLHAYETLSREKSAEAAKLILAKTLTPENDPRDEANWTSEELEVAEDGKAARRKRLAVWDYPEKTAKHHDLAGNLCPESVANAEYVKNEGHIHDLRQTVQADWKAELERAVNTAANLATAESGSGQNQTVAIGPAIDRARAGRAARNPR